MSLAPFIHAMGRGPSRARSLTREEARDSMRLILDGEAAPEAVGALFMLMRYRGEVADEIAGFVDAMRARLAPWQTLAPALDWPSYAAGRSRGLPWFLAAARLVAQAGHPVLLHGWNSHQNPVADVRAALSAFDIPLVRDPAAAREALGAGGIAYVPLDALDPEILRLLRLRDVLGLRSAVNTACRMLNPGGAATSVQGVFHPSYRDLQQDAGALLGQREMIVLKGGGGEFERHPGKAVALYGLRAGTAFETTAPALLDTARRLADPSAEPAHLTAIWTGQRSDPFAEATIIGTAAAALLALGTAGTITTAEAEARRLWAARLPARAA
ncbi:MAG: glycosyl transferase family protein [Pseudomonadota bacterium]